MGEELAIPAARFECVACDKVFHRPFFCCGADAREMVPRPADVDDAGEPRVVTLAFSHREIDRLYTLVGNNHLAIREYVESGECPVPLELVAEDLGLHEALLSRLGAAWDEAEKKKS